MSLRCCYIKPGWAVLITYSDGSSGFMAAEGTQFPKIWASWDRARAVSAGKKLKLSKEQRNIRVVKVKATWPEII